MRDQPPPPSQPPQLQEVGIAASTDKDTGFAPVEAQTASKAPMRRLETPQSVSVITRGQMESRQIVNMQQALQTVAGVSPVNFARRGFDDLNIRGVRSSESILIDGLVQSPGMWTKLQPCGYERRGAQGLGLGAVWSGAARRHRQRGEQAAQEGGAERSGHRGRQLWLTHTAGRCEPARLIGAGGVARPLLSSRRHHGMWCPTQAAPGP